MQETKVILHLDGDDTNNNPDNLMKVTRSELVRLNKVHGISSNPTITRINLDIVRLTIARAEAVRGTEIERQDRKESERNYQKSEKGKKKSCEHAQKYWKLHASDPAWREEYNRKQRERRHRKIK